MGAFNKCIYLRMRIWPSTVSTKTSSLRGAIGCDLRETFGIQKSEPTPKLHPALSILVAQPDPSAHSPPSPMPDSRLSKIQDHLTADMFTQPARLTTLSRSI